MTQLELFGYFAMTIVLLSMTMTDIWVLRILNSIGCCCFAIYGFFHETYPIVIMNTLIIGIHIWKLNQMKTNG